MTIPDVNDPAYVRRQYAGMDNLAARYRLHEEFSTGPDLLPWLWSRMDIGPEDVVLDIGCGPGVLWQAAPPDKLPALAILADLSPGMAAEAGLTRPEGGQVMVADVQALPLSTGGCDVVIANWMLYHVADLDQALSEIRRVLRPGGTLYAGGNGARHLRQLDELVVAHTGALRRRQGAAQFGLDTAPALLAPYFEDIAVERPHKRLEVTDAAAVGDYLRSSPQPFDEYHIDEIVATIDTTIRRHGAFVTDVEPGLVSARRP